VAKLRQKNSYGMATLEAGNAIASKRQRQRASDHIEQWYQLDSVFTSRTTDAPT